MRWDQVDFTSGLWRIPATKNGQPQVLPLLEQELMILRARKAASKSLCVFPTRSKTGHMTEPKNGWERVRTRAGLPDLRMHDLRRSLGSFMVDTGASLSIIGKTLGHQSQAVTAIYARRSMDPIKEAKERAIQAMMEGRSSA